MSPQLNAEALSAMTETNPLLVAGVDATLLFSSAVGPPEIYAQHDPPEQVLRLWEGELHGQTTGTPETIHIIQGS